MQIKLWKTFAKRSNSTKLPPANADAIKSVYLKEDTSQENPVFVIDDIDWDWTYLEWNGHCYFITDKVVGTNHCYELHCRQDALASHRADVLNTFAYIQYASVGGDNFICDRRIGQTVSRLQKTRNGLQLVNNTTNWFILSVVNNRTTFVSYYLLSSAQLQTFAEILLSDNIWQEIILEFGDAVNSILSLRAIPMTDSMVNTMSSQGCFDSYEQVIYIGKTPLINVSTGTPANATAHFKTSAIVQFSDGLIPIIWNYNDFRRLDEQFKIYLPCVGIVDVPTSALLDCVSLMVRCYISPTIGRISYLISGTRIDGESVLDENNIAEYDGEYGWELPLKAKTTNILSGITGIMADTLSVANNVAIGNVANIGTDVLNAGSDLMKLVDNSNTVIGTQGSPIVQSKPRYIIYYTIGRGYVTEPNNLWSVLGRPIEKVDRVGNYTGYVQTINASVGGSMNDGDRTELNNLLNGGVYIE